MEHAFGVFAGKGGQNLACLGELFREGQSRPVPISGRLAELVIRVFCGKLSEQFGGFVVALGQQLGESLHKKSTRGLVGVGELLNEPAKSLHGGSVIPGLLLGHTLQIKNKRKLFRLRKASGKKKCRLDRFVIALDRHPTLQGGERSLLDHRIRIHLAQHVIEKQGALAEAVLLVESAGQTEAHRSVEGGEFFQVLQFFTDLASHLTSLGAFKNVGGRGGIEVLETGLDVLQTALLVCGEPFARPDGLEGTDCFARLALLEKLFAQGHGQRLEGCDLGDAVLPRSLLCDQLKGSFILTRLEQAVQLKHGSATAVGALLVTTDYSKGDGCFFFLPLDNQGGGREQGRIADPPRAGKLRGESAEGLPRFRVMARLQECDTEPER